ncbi:3'-5' exoribonuclease YhaM family protein [Methanosphaera sp. WGK6]|uniref:3'-5' exoribonuclease YhaM family protein n=1 Tax=Methanosphaera sp. WGK6 TaxID=1561964 RepID=UPI00084BD632|nr:HD domain-containing protein [Methanosphaera sp. WGK6]OED30444.1 hypothetical protein NL43_02120 [Methanosphaera sp. WGK6]
MKKKEQDFIKNFREDREIISSFLVKDKEMKRSKTNKPYLELTLQDKTGQIKGRMFSNQSSKLYTEIEINNVWNIVGKIQEFPSNSGKYNILINKLHKTREYEDKDFIRTIENFESHVDYLFNTIKEIKNPYLKKTLHRLFDNDEICSDFLSAPAAKIHHHNYKGGLLIHTNEVIEICKTLTRIYEDLNYDLLITGAILHDIGKIKTYSYKTEDIDITYEGRMLDHIFIGSNLVENILNDINAPDDLKINLIHLILSHHGETSLGWGSPVDPKTSEAKALHYADDISAKITSSLENY